MTQTFSMAGKIIVKLEMTSDKHALRFTFTDGESAIAQTDADCCSHTWIEHVSLPMRGFPASVLEVNNLNMPDRAPEDESEYFAFYGCEIKTDKGSLIIDYRNESNGYYGGSLVWPGEYHYGGVHGQNERNDDWREVTSDI